MALGAGTLWECNASATANMVNGGGFNPGNANMLTNLTTDSNTANTSAPVVSSASYNFVAGDVGNWVYIKSGTNWTPGFYQIASVATNKATLTASIGSAVQLNATTNTYGPNTVVGCATVGTPTNGTFSIDYSQATGTILTAVDYSSVGASTTMTSVTGGFTKAMIGNIFHQTTTGTGAFGVVGWYEIVNQTDTNTVTLDRTPNSGTASVNCTGFTGGALGFNSTLDDDFFEIVLGGNTVFIKNGSYSFGEAVTTAATSSTGTNPSMITGYGSVRGDNPTSQSNWPLINPGAFSWVPAQFMIICFIRITSTATASLSCLTGTMVKCVKIVNTSTTASRACLSPATDGIVFIADLVSQNGFGINISATTNNKTVGVYAHDSNIGIQSASARQTFSWCLIQSCRTTGFSVSTNPLILQNSTIHGWTTQRGTGILIANAIVNVYIVSCIVDSWTTGISQTTAQQFSNNGLFNDWYNNTTLATNYTIDPTDQVLDPQYSNVAEIQGSTATTSGSVLTQSGGDFSTVTDNVDYLHVFSGTGVTTGGYLITSHTSTTVTVNNALGTSSGGDVVYSIPTGRDFSIGTNLKALGFPGGYPGSSSTSYTDIGAIQRQEAGSGSGWFSGE